MSLYRDSIAEEAFGHVPLMRDRARDETSLPLAPPRPDGVYFQAQAGKWLVQFGGTTRFEQFGVEDYDGANKLFQALKEEFS